MGYLQTWEKMLPEWLEVFRNISGGVNSGLFAFSAAAYVLMALGLYTIAKSRNLKNPWLAWVPVANMWLLGCISDQYHYVTKGQERKRRKAMLTLGILELILSPVLVALLVITVMGLVAAFTSGSLFLAGTGVLALALVSLAMIFVLSAISIALLVLRCCAYYDLFSSCEPRNKTLYTVLSVLATCVNLSIVPAVLIFICREKEEGMPPRLVVVDAQ
jgi:hypothetical protein